MPTTERSRRAKGIGGQSLSSLVPQAYDELRRLARGYLRRERHPQTLQTTALVHEAYLRLQRDGAVRWRDRPHFLAIAASSMRQILIERARARQAQKRGSAPRRVALDDALAVANQRPHELLAFDEALTRLASVDRDAANVLELRFYGGLTIEETAAALRLSSTRVKQEWAVARAWIARELRRL